VGLKSKANLAVLCDHCMGKMEPAQLKTYEGDTFMNVLCRLCKRVYSPGPGYRNDPTSARTQDLRPFVMKCKRHDEPVALCIVGFLPKDRMSLVCPVDACNTTEDAPLSSIFLQKGH